MLQRAVAYPEVQTDQFVVRHRVYTDPSGVDAEVSEWCPSTTPFVIGISIDSIKP